MGKKVEMRKSNRYTLMLVPERDGKAKVINISKRKIKGFYFVAMGIFIVTISLILNSLIVFSKNQTLRDEIQGFKENEVKFDARIKDLQELKGNVYQENLNVLEENEEMQKQLSRMVALEEELLRGLEESDVATKLEKSENFVFLDYVADFETTLENTKDLIRKIESEAEKLRRIPKLIPAQGYISGVFGRRVHPIKGESKMHNGLDIANNRGTPIKASADGVIKFAGYTDGFGYLVIINHMNGYETYYAHNSKLLVKEGQKVQRGDKIALMGTTGTSTGTHCHFEVRLNGVPVNPSKFVKY